MTGKREIKPKDKDQLPAAIDFAKDKGGGFEGADSNAFAIPFLAILQSGSPQCKKSEGAYIKGAEEGFIFNTVTETFVDGIADGIRVIPVAYTRRKIEWEPRESGGGFVQEYLPEDAPVAVERNEKGQDVLPNGNILVDTRNHYVILLTADGPVPALISMSSTQLKRSRRWMSLMQGRRHEGQSMPTFANIYHLTTIPESNDHGSWYSWKIVHDEVVSDPEIYQMAKDFGQQVQAGLVTAKQPGENETEKDVPF